MAEYRYKLGDSCSSGQKISVIFGQSSKGCSYQTEDDHLRWEYFANNGDLPPELAPALPIFDRLMADIGRHVPRRQKREAYAQLAKALFSVMDAGPIQMSSFNEVDGFIKTTSLERARLVYVISCSSVVVLLMVICLGLLIAKPWAASTLASLGILGGALGAMISVAQRSNEILVDARAGKEYLVVQGAARTVLGSLFGLFLVCASKSNLLVGFISTSDLALFTLAIVAGFSERLVPELLKKFEAEQIKPAAGAPKSSGRA